GLVFDTECNVRLIIDRDLLNESVIGCHPCINTSSLAINREKIIEKIIPATNHTPTYVEL
ncbi:MAG: prolyl-tRNA synthetase associated domain-containing protein, partial [Clostridia bacterium]|nr:prolyl-tRNA synthetase associated domain-containing protein [Clostridia bacterium]